MVKCLLRPGIDDACCGGCRHMEYEDTYGYGHCGKIKLLVHCSLACDYYEPRKEE